MSVTIGFRTLADAYAALMLAYSGVDVVLHVPEGLPLLAENVIMCRFVQDGVFSGRQSACSYSELESAARMLHSWSPNTVYPETIYAVQDRSIMRDLANRFRGREYRDIFAPDAVDIFRPGVSLASGKVLRSAPAYRFNYSRHVVAVLRSIAAMGGRVVKHPVLDTDLLVPVAGQAVEHTFGCLAPHSMPTRQRSLYIPGGVWVFARCGQAYAALEAGAQGGECFSSAFDAMVFMLTHSVSIALHTEDMPLEALVAAHAFCGAKVKTMASEADGNKLADLAALRLDGSAFQFMPSVPDVVGYADYCFDWVKRMGVDVDVFKNAVFDYGTNIEAIVNDMYDIYPAYHDGPRAFAAAVDRWRAAEMPW